jgi:hypothetical protein
MTTTPVIQVATLPKEPETIECMAHCRRKITVVKEHSQKIYLCSPCWKALTEVLWNLVVVGKEVRK